MSSEMTPEIREKIAQIFSTEYHSCGLTYIHIASRLAKAGLLPNKNSVNHLFELLKKDSERKWFTWFCYTIGHAIVLNNAKGYSESSVSITGSDGSLLLAWYDKPHLSPDNIFESVKAQNEKANNGFTGYRYDCWLKDKL